TAVQALAIWKQTAAAARVQGAAGVLLHWTSGGGQSVSATGADSRALIGRSAEAEFVVSESFRAQFLASSNGTLTVRLNGRLVYERPKSGPYLSDSDRFDADLQEGI